jgi:DNA-binding transcriptional LysR family regulator
MTWSYSPGWWTAALPKSTISRRIKQLEESLSVRLLQRTTRSLTLTELGAVFYERCKRVQAEADEAERSVSEGQEMPKGILRLTAPIETGFRQFGRILADYSKFHPEVQVEIDLSNRFVDIVEEGYDLAIRAGTLPDSTLVARKLGSSRMQVCASPSYLEAHEPPVTPGSLNEHTLLLYDNTLKKSLWNFTGPEGTAGVVLQPKHCANSLMLLRDMVKSGYGIALLPSQHIQQDLERGDLVLLLSEWKLPEMGIYAVYPSPRHLTPKVKSFIDFLSQQDDLIV